MTLPLPAGWQDSTQLLAQEPVEGGVRPTLMVTRDAARAGESLTAFATRQAALLMQMFPGAKKLSEQEVVLGGKRGVLREQQFTLNGKALSQLVFLTLTGGGAYTLVFSCAASRAPSHRKTAEKLFADAKLSG